MCELAENSVLQSGFENTLKQHWLGKNYQLGGVRGNNVAKSNVPDIRKEFRQDALNYERSVYVLLLVVIRFFGHLNMSIAMTGSSILSE